jgi:hypothetical protein
MKLRYLIDENLSTRLKGAIQRIEPLVDVLRVGDQGAPPLGTLDPDVLIYLTATRRLLVTDNRKSMPKHLVDHAAAEFQHWGIFVVSKDAPIGALADELYLYWEVSEAEEWIDRTEWLKL